MRRIARLLSRLSRDRRGATAIEYGFLLAMIALAIMASLIALGGINTTIWNNVSDKVRAVTP